MKPKKRLTQIFLLMLSGVSLASILLISILWINFEQNRSEAENIKISKTYISNQENHIQLEADRIYDYIEIQKESSLNNGLKIIKKQTYEIDKIINNITTSQSNILPQNEIENIIINTISSLDSFNNNYDYYILTPEGKNLLQKQNISVINDTNNILIKPKNNSNEYENLTAVVSDIKINQEGFYQIYTDKSTQDKLENDNKIIYLKSIKFNDWIVGSGVYLNSIQKETQNNLLDWVNNMPMPEGKHLMIINYNGDLITYPKKELIGINIFEDKSLFEYQKTAASLIREAKSNTKGFTHYTTKSPGSNIETEKTAYYRVIPDWNWIIITWFYTSDLDKQLAEEQSLLRHNVKTQLYRIIAITISMLLIVVALYKVVSKMASKSFTSFFNFFEQASTSSIELNPDYQPFEEFAKLAVAANKMINQTKVAEKLLRASELKFKTIFDMSPQIIIISDLVGNLIDASHEYGKYSYLPLKEAIGHPVQNSFPLIGEHLKNINKKIKTQGVISGIEISRVNEDGTELVLLSFAKMIHLGNDSFILSIFANITPLKNALNEKLVLQEKLASSKKMEAMGLMAAEVAHDLNNILSGIIGYPQLLLLDQNLNEQQKDALNEILNTGKKAAAVVSDLLTIARGVVTVKESISLNETIQNYIQSPEYKQLKKLFPNINLQLDLTQESSNIIASSVHLTKIIMNLVSNAFEAIKSDNTKSFVKIVTSICLINSVNPINQLQPGKYIKLEIIDNGPGISELDLKYIFEPFFSKKDKGRSGTGLGLAIVLNTVKDHNGDITVQSDKKGTKFILYFPCTEIKPISKKEKILANYKGNGEKILVVDDVEIQRKLACKMLDTLGYQSMAVASGEAAIEYLKHNDIDLVILDMIMYPGINGRETFAAIRSFKPEQKAIIASGLAETDEVEKAQALGAGVFVNKPYTLEDIAEAVKKALNSQS